MNNSNIAKINYPSEFDDIRPFSDEEMAEVTEKLLADKSFESIINAVFPEIGWENFKVLFRSFKTPYELQSNFIMDKVFTFTGSSSTGVSSDGFYNVAKDGTYTYISNHRDIVLDALLLNAMLVKQGFMTTEVAIGDNLLIYPWIENIVRMNNNFIVKRGISMHQMLENSKHLSQYIHFAIEQKKQSIWIAQREGRAKDSNDRTQESIIKMLAMGGSDNFLQNTEKLNITPVSISYEYDPCDYLKAKEFQQKRDNPDFKKTQMDDLQNMLTGLKGFKGKIHFQIGHPINPDLQKIKTDTSRNDAAKQIASLIDNEIFRNYQLFPVNYIAYDRLWGNGSQKNQYTKEDEKKFDEYFKEKIAKIDLPHKDIPFLTEKLLAMYAWPVRNQISILQ
ncbi:MAG: 1-acyl-sn-glycerol-3-phosphate acyltransferase [Dysgonamonadaceae bacterium]|jgi:hypothetical protein|nr:1-acyl-sn-glycerol-3-phosphate acyltransferase [Dysgonamonadaceae bacterium]